MAVSHDGEISNGVQLKKVRTHDYEKITSHEISGPGRLEERKGVKDVEDLFPFSCCNIVDLGCKGFKTCVSVQGIYFDTVRRFEERSMVGESHIDDFPSLCNGILDKGKDKVMIVINLVNLPDYVVSQPETIEDLIKAGQTCACGKR